MQQIGHSSYRKVTFYNKMTAWNYRPRGFWGKT